MNNQLFQEFKPYVVYNLTQPKSDGSYSNNGARYSAETVVALKNHDGLSPEAIDVFKKGYADIELQPGLLMRLPNGEGGQESIDDVRGAITADYYLKTGFSGRWLKYGREQYALKYGEDSQKLIDKILSPVVFVFKKILWFGKVQGCYNNLKPRVWTLSAWMWRQKQVVTTAKIVYNSQNPENEEKLTLFEKLYWCFVIGFVSAYFTKKSDADGWVLAWHSVKASKTARSRIIQWGRLGWVRKFKKTHSRGIGGVLRAYYNWPDHPNSKYLIDEFGE